METTALLTGIGVLAAFFILWAGYFRFGPLKDKIDKIRDVVAGILSKSDDREKKDAGPWWF